MSKGNTGEGNTGHWNSGDWNSGDCNSGDCNSGHCNSGHRNSGNWNSGDRNSGALNTDTPKVRMFNKQTDLDWGEIEFPSYFRFSLTERVGKSEMSEGEKEEHPEYETTGGYLRVYEYKEAWRKAWDEADDEDRRKTLELPNWDNEIFKEITGIDVEKELGSSESRKMSDKEPPPEIQAEIEQAKREAEEQARAEWEWEREKENQRRY